MGLLRDLVRRRSDLKLILMSATINIELFQNYFKDAPLLKVIFIYFCILFTSVRNELFLDIWSFVPN